MNEKQIIKEALKSISWTQTMLAEKCGYKTEQGVNQRLRGSSMRVDTFVKFLDAMGYEVIVRSKSPNTNKNKWTVGGEEE